MMNKEMFNECDDTRQSETKNVLISSIEIAYQIRPISKSHIEGMVASLKNGGELPPITVFKFPKNETYYIIDGSHRLEAVKKSKQREILSKIIYAHENDSIATVGKLACLANSQNGRNYSTSENYGRIIQYLTLEGVNIDDISDQDIKDKYSSKFIVSSRVIKNAIKKYKEGKIDEFGHKIKPPKEEFDLEEKNKNNKKQEDETVKDKDWCDELRDSVEEELFVRAGDGDQNKGSMIANKIINMLNRQKMDEYEYAIVLKNITERLQEEFNDNNCMEYIQ